MKNCVVLEFIVISCLLMGCDDSVVNEITEKSKEIVVVNEQKKDQLKVDKLTKNQLVLPIKEKNSDKRKVVKVKAKLVAKSLKPGIKETPILVDEAQSRRILDLTLPAASKKQIASNKNYQKQPYLPDLFRHKKVKKKYALQVDGRMLNREEKEADKVSSTDGVGIDVRLYP